MCCRVLCMPFVLDALVRGFYNVVGMLVRGFCNTVDYSVSLRVYVMCSTCVCMSMCTPDIRLTPCKDLIVDTY